jgi:hypothetical protein
MMYFNALYCASGDNTLASIEIAVQDIVKQPADDYFVFALSGKWEVFFFFWCLVCSYFGYVILFCNRCKFGFLWNQW